MAKIGYLVSLFHNDKTEKNREWMKQFGCMDIIEEQSGQEWLRPEWNKLLTNLNCGDVLVIPKLSHVIRETRQLSFFLELCRIKTIRLIAIQDKIDSGNELFPETQVSDVLHTFALLPKEINAVRKTFGHIRKLKGRIKVLSQAAYNRVERRKLIVNMYKSGHTIDDIWKACGFKSRSSVFRVLNEAGVNLNRGHTKGPLNRKKG